MSFSTTSIGKWMRYAGLAAAILFWIVSGISISYNSWFNFTKDAFSALGDPDAQNPWIYNYGLIIIGVFILIYSFSLINDATNKLEISGGAFTIVSGLFLIMIGVYHSGTEPHNFVSTWFFIQADIALLAWGIGLLSNEWNNFGKIIIILGVLGSIGAVIIPWPSAAMIEAYGIIIITIWVVLMLKIQATR